MSNIVDLLEVRRIKQDEDEKKNNKAKDNIEAKYYHGHRKRAKDRLMQVPLGSTSVRDLMEILLFYTHPRSDTKPMADAIVKKMGSMSKILFATKSDIANIPNVSNAFLLMMRIIREISIISSREMIEKSSNVSEDTFQNWNSVYTYLRNQMSSLDHITY